MCHKVKSIKARLDLAMDQLKLLDARKIAKQCIQGSSCLSSKRLHLDNLLKEQVRQSRRRGGGGEMFPIQWIN